MENQKKSHWRVYRCVECDREVSRFKLGKHFNARRNGRVTFQMLKQLHEAWSLIDCASAGTVEKHEVPSVEIRPQ